MGDNRRDFIKKTALLSLAGLAGGLAGKERFTALETITDAFSDGTHTFTLPDLPYAYAALEPFIDKKTMEIHHSKHHQAYINNLNVAADLNTIDFNVSDAVKCTRVNVGTSSAIRNNLGGHYNHSLFWTLLKPNPGRRINMPSGTLNEKIIKTYGSFDEFKKTFTETASKFFGSGWCWLITDESKNLNIVTTPNQDNPLMNLGEKGFPVLALDVWEHAYYLKYQNKRAEYINNWWSVVNWERAEELFTQK